ncbi:MAG TPA: transglutaminase-like domain-containing protein, partial [Anaeromyxobacteraceae bacterium]|nr:transglutaminase-like domain-containing protein [Anaeromyxobacteraceae bacterium]
MLGEDRISEARAVGSEPARERPIASRPSLLLACECSSIVNFAMEQNGVPIVHEVAVRNEGPAAVAGAVIEVESGPGLSELLSLPVPELKPGQEHRVSPVDIRLLPGRLRAVVEAERGEIRCRVVRGGVTLAERRNDVRILAFNEWPGQEAPPGLLASFVLPNHPAVATLLQGVRTNLVSAGLSDALDGYQGGGRERVREQAKALYAAVQSLGIGYVVAPPSFEVSGQKIRLPDAVLKDRLGCCLDLSVLFAAALELMGIAPVLVLLRGHAFVAAWLTDDRFSSGVIDDVARLRTQAQSGNLLLLETTAVTRAQPVAFESAFESAYQRLGDDAAFEWAVDVRALRTEYRPLSIRASPGPDAGELLPEAGA